MTSKFTTLAGQLAEALAKVLDDEERSIALADAMKILAVSVDHTDAYLVITDAAATILAQAETNKEAIADYHRSQLALAQAINAGIPANQVWK